ncbi:23 kDa integral membrane protein [Malaya genurostris]|uniref:23 kDa integral membrane protein n=1 Tax=Malaya genurostris TaxID=325434 RepID=UPI0026F39C2A|nr:23 kDa integral membrane protein [Malaya genurostris]
MKSLLMDSIRDRLGSCGTATIKYLLFVFNLIFAVSGLILLIAGILVLLDVNDYQHFVEDKLIAPPVVLIVVGTLVFLVASLGCYGAIKESPKLLNAFAVFLLIVLIIEVAVAIAAIAFKADLQNALETQLEKSITRHNSADMGAWNSVHKKMMCCGIQGPKDWYDNNNRTMPASCCKPDLIDTETNDCKNALPLFMDRYYQEGCLMKLKEHFDKNAVVLIAVGFAIAAFQLLGILFACWLSSVIKRDRH